MLAGKALNGDADDPAGFFLSARFRFIENTASDGAGVLQAFQLDFFEQQRARFGGAEFGQGLEVFPPLLHQSGQFLTLDVEFLRLAEAFLLLVTQALLFLDHAFQLVVNQRLAFHQPLLGFLVGIAPSREGTLRIFAQF
jgi:hypothetical protein